MPARCMYAVPPSSWHFCMQGYGLSETCGGSFVALPRSSHAGTVGPPVAALELRFEGNTELGYDPLGSPPRGEICIRGPQVFAGYHKDEKKTNEAFGELRMLPCLLSGLRRTCNSFNLLVFNVQRPCAWCIHENGCTIAGKHMRHAHGACASSVACQLGNFMDVSLDMYACLQWHCAAFHRHQQCLMPACLS